MSVLELSSLVFIAHHALKCAFQCTRVSHPSGHACTQYIISTNYQENRNFIKKRKQTESCDTI